MANKSLNLAPYGRWTLRNKPAPPVSSTLAIMFYHFRIRHLLVSLLIYFLSTYSVAHGSAKSEMSGTWLIAVEPHDFFIESGVIAAEYPVLVISDQGDFRAYRFGVDCLSDITRNELMPEMEKFAPCIGQLANSDADQLTGLAFPIAQGKVLAIDSGWRFQPNDRQLMIDAIKNSNDINPLVDGIPYQYVIFTKLFDEVLHVSVRKNKIEFVGPSGRFGYRFVRVDPAHIAGIGSLLNALGLSYGQYFRCAMQNIKDIKILKHAEQIQRLSNQRHILNFRFLESGLKQYLADLQRLSENSSDLNTELLEMPAARANALGKIGTHIGCPDRDR